MANDDEPDPRTGAAPWRDEEPSADGIISGTVPVRGRAADSQAEVLPFRNAHAQPDREASAARTTLPSVAKPALVPPAATAAALTARAPSAPPPPTPPSPGVTHDPTTFQASDVFKWLEILRLLGKGYSGEVYLVRDRRSRELRALKVTRPHNRGDARSTERSLAEAEATFGIRHDNVIQVVDIGCEPDGMVWMLMEYIEGTSLDEVLRRKRCVSLRWALHLALGIAWGLDAAHENQIIHRDVKPGNVLLTEDWEPVLIDFSIAKPIPHEMATTQPNMKLGTPGYMAPEYLDGEPVDARMDIYSTGIVLWEMLAGRNPFRKAGADICQVLRAQVTRDPEPLTQVAGVPGYVNAVVMCATARNPDDRYISAAELAKALQAVLWQVERDVLGGRLLAPQLPGEPPLPNQRPRGVYVAPTTGPTLELPARAPSARVVVDAPPTATGPLGTTALNPAALLAAAVDPRPPWAQGKAAGDMALQTTGPMLRAVERPATGDDVGDRSLASRGRAVDDVPEMEPERPSRREPVGQAAPGRQAAPLWMLLPAIVASALLTGLVMRWLGPAGGAAPAPAAPAPASAAAPGAAAPGATELPAAAPVVPASSAAPPAGTAAPAASASATRGPEAAPRPGGTSSAASRPPPTRPRPARQAAPAQQQAPPGGSVPADDFFLRPPPKAPPRAPPGGSVPADDFFLRPPPKAPPRAPPRTRSPGPGSDIF